MTDKELISSSYKLLRKRQSIQWKNVPRVWIGSKNSKPKWPVNIWLKLLGLREMQVEVTPCPSGWQKFKKMLTPTIDGGERKSIFSYVSFKKRTDTAISGSYIEKNLFKKFKFP